MNIHDKQAVKTGSQSLIHDISRLSKDVHMYNFVP